VITVQVLMTDLKLLSIPKIVCNTINFNTKKIVNLKTSYNEHSYLRI